MRETTQATWLARIEEWRRSGKTAAEFAEGQPFSGSTLTWRASQLRHKARPERQTRATQKASGTGAARVVFAEVVPCKHPAAGAGLTVEIGSARISVSSGFDGALLRDVVLALGKAAS